MKDITLLIAHPDDEILFLWPFLSRAARIIACVSDEQNAERAWCNKRRYALEEVCKVLGCQMHCMEANSGFYRMPTRTGALKSFMEEIGAALSDAEIIATHNPWGEYGHIDHILCHHAARTFAGGRSVLTTDITVESNWLPVKPWLLSDNPREYEHLDVERFNVLRAIYERYGCWTYDKPPVEQCGVITC